MTMRTMFGLYVFCVLAGLTVYLIVGLTHR